MAHSRSPTRAPAAPTSSIANVALGLFTNYAELGQRNFTQWRSLATDAVHSGLVEAANEPDDRRRCALGLLAAVVLDDEQHRQFHGVVLRSGTIKRSWIGRPVCSSAAPIQRRRAAGRRLQRGRGQLAAGVTIPPCMALFRGVPRGFSETHANVFEPRVGMSYALDAKTILRASTGIFHNRVTLNDSTLLGGNPPSSRRRRSRTAASTIRAERRSAARTCRLPSPRRIRCSSTRHPTCGRRECSVKSRAVSRWT